MFNFAFQLLFSKEKLKEMGGSADLTTILKTTHAKVNEQFPALIKGLDENGWKTETDSLSLESSSARRLSIR